MELLLILLQLIVLAFVTVQDFKYRGVFWALFPVLFLCNIFIVRKYLDNSSMLFNLSVNASIILVQLLALTLYFSVKNNKLVWIVNKYLGVGDILMLFAMSVLFTPEYFIVYITGAMLAGLLFGLIAKAIRQTMVSIPLAGVMSLVFFPFSLLEVFRPGYTVVARFTESQIFIF